MDARELDYLARSLPRGRACATSVPSLAASLSVNERTVRDGIERLVNERRLPVVTLPTSAGVFVAVTPEELDLGDEHLRAKAMALLRRRRSLRLCREQLAYTERLF